MTLFNNFIPSVWEVTGTSGAGGQLGRIARLGRFLMIGAGGFTVSVRNTDTGATHNVSGLLVQGSAGLGLAAPINLQWGADLPSTGITRILTGPASGGQIDADSFNGWAIVRGFDARLGIGGYITAVYFTRWYDVAMAIPLSRGVSGISAADLILERATKALCFVAGLDIETCLGIGMNYGRFLCRVE